MTTPVGTTTTTTTSNNNNVERRKTTSTAVVVSLVGVALAYLVQFGGIIWWGATLSSDVRHGTETLARIEMGSYTKAEAVKDQQRLDAQDAAILAQVLELRNRVVHLEDRMDNVKK